MKLKEVVDRGTGQMIASAAVMLKMAELQKNPALVARLKKEKPNTPMVIQNGKLSRFTILSALNL